MISGPRLILILVIPEWVCRLPLYYVIAHLTPAALPSFFGPGRLPVHVHNNPLAFGLYSSSSLINTFTLAQSACLPDHTAA